MGIYKKIISIVIYIILLSSMVVSAESVSLVLDFSQFDDMIPEEIGGSYVSTKLDSIPWTKSGIEGLLGSEIESWDGDKIATWDGQDDTAFFHINKNIGKDGAGLRMQSTTGTNTELYFVQEALEEGKISIFSYDFKVIRRNSSVNNYFRVAGGFKNVSFINTKTDPDYFTDEADTTKKAPFEENKWYKVVVIVDGYQANSYLYDEDGIQILTSAKTYATTTENTGAQIARLDGYVRGGTEMILDNIEKHVYYPEQTAPSLIASSIESGEDEIRRNTSFEFTFNQEIDGNVIIKDKDGETVSDFNTVKTTKTAYNKVKVTLEDGFLLDRDEDYTISFEGIVNSTNVASDAEDITFTTEDLHTWNDVIIGDVLQNGENTDITFTLDDSFGYSKFSGAMIAARYEDGVMKAVSTVSLEDVSVGIEVTKSFALGTLTDKSEFRLMQLDLTNGPVVIAIGKNS